MKLRETGKKPDWWMSCWWMLHNWDLRDNWCIIEWRFECGRILKISSQNQKEKNKTEKNMPYRYGY